MNRKEALAAIDPEFLVPAAKHVMHIRGPVTLRIARFFNNRATNAHPDVQTRRTALPGSTGTSIVIHTPATRDPSRGALIWIFGGGLISGSAAHVSDIASSYATALGVVVIVPDYRLAPENTYPAAIDDCYETLTWLLDHADELDVDVDRIIVGGESAGAGLAAALAQRARDSRIPLRLQVLVAPMLDDRSVLEAESQRRSFMVWTVPSSRFAWEAYLGHSLEDTEERPYAVPARTETLAGVAPAWISVGEADLFHDESVEYARRLTAAGVPTSITTIPGAHHGWELLTPDHRRVHEIQAARRDAMQAALSK